MSDQQGNIPTPAELTERWKAQAKTIKGDNTADAMQRHMLRQCAADLELSLKNTDTNEQDA